MLPAVTSSRVVVAGAVMVANVFVEYGVENKNG